MIASKYHALLEEVAKLKTENQCVLLSARPKDRARIAANVKYHLDPPKGYTFCTKYISPHIYIFLKPCS